MTECVHVELLVAGVSSYFIFFFVFFICLALLLLLGRHALVVVGGVGLSFDEQVRRNVGGARLRSPKTDRLMFLLFIQTKQIIFT